MAVEGERVFSVWQITSEIRGLLGAEYDDLWVEGEVSRLTRARSGHIYFDLREPSENAQREASLSAVMFRREAERGAPLRPGALVRCRGRIDVYPPRGNYQLIVKDCRPAGEGALLVQLERIKKRLAAEGLFAAERKRPLPYLPRTVGVVTSPTGAAVRDILKVLRRRFPVRVLLAPATVQGRSAPAELIQALTALDRRDDVDVIILARGGGSTEDLWCFNDEGLARAVAACGKPVVSAIGHEVDTVLTDLTADSRAPTPSAAAEAVVPERAEIAEGLGRTQVRLERAARRELAQRRQRVDLLVQTGTAVAGARVARSRRALALLVARLRRRHPGARLAAGRARLSALLARLERATRTKMEQRRRRLVALTATLRTLGPEEQLARGYAVVRVAPAADVVLDSRQAPKGTLVNIMLHRGALDARVESSGD